MEQMDIIMLVWDRIIGHARGATPGNKRFPGRTISHQTVTSLKCHTRISVANHDPRETTGMKILGKTAVYQFITCVID